MSIALTEKLKAIYESAIKYISLPYRALLSSISRGKSQKSAVNNSDSDAISDQTIAALIAGNTDKAPDPENLNCRVQLINQQENNPGSAVFSVEICGTIRSPEPVQSTVVMVMITDVTYGTINPLPIKTGNQYTSLSNIRDNIYNTDIGSLNNEITRLNNWMTVLKIAIEPMTFARSGKRCLMFNLAIINNDRSIELAAAQHVLVYENPNTGYLDVKDNIHRSRQLAVTLGFAVAASNGTLFDCELDYIYKWARANIQLAVPTQQATKQLKKALDKSVAFFLKAGKLDMKNMTMEIAKIAPVAEKYAIMDLCLNVVATKGYASRSQIQILKDIADWLSLDRDKFRTMTEKILPVHMHQEKDPETIFGLTCEMDEEQARRQLTKEYAKWSARVTSTDSSVRSQADQMLQLIAQARADMS